MRSAVTRLLASPSSPADRRRMTLVAGSTAVAGGFLLAALRIARVDAPVGSRLERDLASYIDEPGLRPGVVTAVVLLLVPIVSLALQCVRVGSLARDRRMAALRLAGATPTDVRRVAAVEAGSAALAGGVLSMSFYLLLWIVAGLVPPAGARMLPPPDLLDLAAWPLVAVACGAIGALAGAFGNRRVVADPLGVYRRARTHPDRRLSWLLLLAGAGLVAAGRVDYSWELSIVLTLVGIVLGAFGAGPLLVAATARRARERAGAEVLLAGWRLESDPAGAGRVASVLIVCGAALAIESLVLVDGGAELFYVAGTGMAVTLTVVAAGVAVLTMFVGATDHLLDAREPLAALSVLGAEEAQLVRMLERQLSITAVPALVLGAAVTALYLIGGGWGPVFDPASFLWLIPISFITALGALGVRLSARWVARLLRSPLRTAMSPENLRVT